MAAGFGNLGAVTFSNYAFLAVAGMVQQISGPGWSAAVGDITGIDAADGQLMTKVVSGRHDQQPITVSFFSDANLASHDAPGPTTNTGVLAITYPVSEAGFSMTAGMTAFKYGDLILDEVMVGECEFMLIGGATLDGVNTA